MVDNSQRGLGEAQRTVAVTGKATGAKFDYVICGHLHLETVAWKSSFHSLSSFIKFTAFDLRNISLGYFDKLQALHLMNVQARTHYGFVAMTSAARPMIRRVIVNSPCGLAV